MSKLKCLTTLEFLEKTIHNFQNLFFFLPKIQHFTCFPFLINHFLLLNPLPQLFVFISYFLKFHSIFRNCLDYLFVFFIDIQKMLFFIDIYGFLKLFEDLLLVISLPSQTIDFYVKCFQDCLFEEFQLFESLFLILFLLRIKFLEFPFLVLPSFIELFIELAFHFSDQLLFFFLFNSLNFLSEIFLFIFLIPIKVNLHFLFKPQEFLFVIRLLGIF